MNEKPQSNGQAWMLAIRPRTLPASLSGVVMGGALAWWTDSFHFGAFFACLFAALMLQIGSNLANDVFDFERGLDTAERLGPTRVTQAGLLSPRQVKIGMGVVFGLAALAGAYLIWRGGWPILVIGAASILAAIFYTAGPLPLGYYGLGDLLVFIFFGLVSVAGTYFALTGSVSPAAWWMSVPPGLIITDILVVNNLRDLENDRKGKKRTLAVLLGARGAKIEYLLCMGIAYLIIPIAAWRGLVPWTAMLSWLSLPLAAKSTWAVFSRTGRPLNAALAETGQTTLALSLLFWLGLLLA